MSSNSDAWNPFPLILVFHNFAVTAAFWPLVEKFRGFCDLHLEFYSLTQKAPFLNRGIRAHSLRNMVSLYELEPLRTFIQIFMFFFFTT
jgi:hypothetical protein